METYNKTVIEDCKNLLTIEKALDSLRRKDNQDTSAEERDKAIEALVEEKRKIILKIASVGEDNEKTS